MQQGRQCLERTRWWTWAVATTLMLAALSSLRADAPAQAPPPPARHGLLLSDIHFDPCADPALLPRLVQTPAEGWDAILGPDRTAPFAKPGSDANYSLMTSALENAKTEAPGDVVLYTGDVLRHGFREAFLRAGGAAADYPAFAVKTAVYVVRKMQSTLGAPVVFASGNNDTTEGDYVMSPDNDLFAALAPELTVLAASPEARATFRHGGYYVIPHPTVPNQDVVVLNSVLWSSGYQNGHPGLTDPGLDEMAWLDSVLSRARSGGRAVTLVMHIPPGDDAFASARARQYVPMWEPDAPHDYAALFSGLMRKYAGVVRMAFAGHTHMDDFRVLYDGVTPLVPFRLTPAVSPIFGNNPGFAEYDYDPQTAAVRDVVTYVSPGSLGKPWPQEYRFTAAYGASPGSAADLSALAARLRAPGSARDKWETYYAVSAKSPITDANRPYYLYAQTRMAPGEFAIGIASRP